MARPQPSGPMVSAIVMATILAIYLVLVGWRALQFLQTGNPVAVVMGSALLVLPLIGAWALWRELWFGMRSAALVRELEAEGGLELGIALGPTGRPTRAGGGAEFGIVLGPTGRPARAGASAGFSRFRDDAESSPDSWRVWLRLGVVYEAAGDRRRARQAIPHAIELAQQNRQDRRE